MFSIDDVLKSMLKDMERYRQEYNQVTVQVNTIIKDYTEKIDELQRQRLALQEEGNKKIDILNAKREQLSGKHSSLYEQYKKFTENKLEFENQNNDNVDANKVDIIKESMNNKPESKKSTNKVKTKKENVKTTPDNSGSVEKVDGLSPDEIAKLAEIVDETIPEEKVSVDENGNEIPDYLQDAYKK